MKLLYFQIFIILLLSWGCKKTNKSDSSDNAPRKDSINTIISENNANDKINIPVSKLNPAVASTTLDSMTFDGKTYINYSPKNVLDFTENTAWIEGSGKGGVGEWIALYLGEGGAIKDISELEVNIKTNYQHRNKPEIGDWVESKLDYLKPVKLKLELYVDRNVVASSDTVNHEEIIYPIGYSYLLKSNIKNLLTGIIWLKITIIKTEIGWENYNSSKKKNNVCIGDVILNFRNDNPHNVRESLSRFAKGINDRNKTIISEFTNIPYKKVLSYFTNEDDPDAVPGCSTKDIKIHSENIAILFAAEGGDGSLRVEFVYKNNKWFFKETHYFWE
ncbi:MAG TPA: hypothetical protein VIL99_10850 [Ignavibacteria bacterium]